ncbi:MAG: hypothetical protein DRI57_01535 [Deltaproteobacteria bacterium]|nr:MAG: hypothetical protein DRI57_01535 [Deltaproteobacteria bacterium]
MERENYYILLELPVDESNCTKIEAAIKKKQAEWSRLRNHPSKGRKAQLYLGFISDIKRVMADDNLRRAEVNEAKVLSAQIEKEKYKALDDAIKILSSKGSISEKEISRLAKKFPKIPEPDIRKRIKVPIAKDKKQKQGRKTLDKTTARKIADALQILGKSSLYDFIERSPTSSLKALQNRTKDKDAEIRKVSHKDAAITASGELIGHCLNIFNSKGMRDAYDATLAQALMAALDEAIDTAGSADKHIAAQVYDALMKKALSLRMKKDEADEYIKEYCNGKKWAVNIPAKLSIDEMRQCGVCGIMNLSGSSNCSDCGHPLIVKCPKCKHTSPSTAHVCNKCGFHIGDMPNATRLIEKGKVALAQKDLDGAISLFQQAGVFWPDHPEITNSILHIRSQKHAVEQVVQKIHSLINNRLFYQSRQALAKLRNLDQSHPELSLGKKINQKIAAAESWVKKAKTATDGDKIIDAYSTAITECKDCQEAIEGMAKLPPDPPGRLNTSTLHQTITLEWAPSKSRGDIVYRVLRKTGSQPVNSSDGDILAETLHTVLDDPKAEPGQFYYYAVFSVRGEVASRHGAIAGPLMRMAEIENLQIIPGDSCLNFSWKVPARAREVEVWRKKGGVPLKPGDGQRLSGVRIDGFTDAGLINDMLYSYFMAVIFQDEKGKKCLSPGMTCQSRPIRPPEPINDLKIQKIGKNLDFRWLHPAKGTVLLFFSKHPFPFSTGTSFSKNQISELGTQIPVQRMGNAQWHVNFQGAIHVLPVTVEGDIAVAGESKTVTSIDDIKNLRGEISSGKIYLEWDWPAGSQKVLVAYKYHDYPQTSDDTSAMSTLFTKKQYDKESGFVIRKPEKKDHYFTVFVMADEGSQTLCSTGRQSLVSNAEVQEIFYEVQIAKNLLGKIKSSSLVLTGGNASKIRIPEAILVKKIGNLPLRKSDGNVVCTVKKGTVIRTEPTAIEISTRELARNTYAKLFFVDDNQLQKYRLMSRGKEKLRLF